MGVASTQASGLNRIEPGDPAASYLVNKLDGSHSSVGGNGSRMPRNLPQLSQPLRGMIREWIAAGARDD